MPLQETSGNLTTDAFGGGVAAVTNYIEDVFSTWLYTGTGATQSIVNNIDLSTNGGMVWLKARDVGYNNEISDTARGVNKQLVTNNSNAQQTETNRLTNFNTNGFTLSTGDSTNQSTKLFTSWTFRKQPKFFDVVTWTGSGSSGQVIPHSLGVQPKVIICKCTSSASNWQYNDANDKYLLLNSTAASASSNRDGGWIPQYNATATTLTTQNYNGNSNVNASGETYVAYLFASNAGGFGLTGTDNVITCGSVTLNGSGAGSVTLGYEPQWILLKNSQAAENWQITDNMRGMPVGSSDALLLPNTAGAESYYDDIDPTATGFNIKGLNSSQTYIYIAIRRGPMKVPTTGTSVYTPIVRTGTGTTATVSGVGFPPDLVIASRRSSPNGLFWDRLRGVNANSNPVLYSTTTAAEVTSNTNGVQSFTMDGMTLGNNYDGENANGASIINWFMRRAPSFFDEVCYTGTGATGNAVSHNLGVAPELIIVKGRSGTIGTNDWQVLANISSSGYSKLFLDTTDAALGPYNYSSNAGLAAQPTSTTFTVNNVANFNNGSTNYVAYLFATCAGVSKVGTYTGNGTTQTIDCGFTGGARFVIIKRTDSTGDWYTYDTARGMTVLTDPYLTLNSTAAETATLGSVTTVSTGFALNSTILAAINISSGTYIFLAVA